MERAAPLASGAAHSRVSICCSAASWDPLDLEGAHVVRRLLEEREFAMEERAKLGIGLAGFRGVPEPDGFIT